MILIWIAKFQITRRGTSSNTKRIKYGGREENGRKLNWSAVKLEKLITKMP